MFIQKLFSPKWKHKNPNIRKEALQALNPAKEDTQKIFAEVVKIDSDLTIRRMVVGRLRDMELLNYLRQTQDQLADSAVKRMRQLMAGTGPYAIDFALRKQSLEQTNEQETLEFVAREAAEADLRRLAVEKIERQSLLGDIAVNDADADVRLAALDKVTQISTLDRVYKNSRLKDKRVSALAKERLDVLTAELERPKVLKKEARQACLDLESLVQRCRKNGAWLGAHPRFEALQSAWQTAKSQWQDSYGAWDETLSASFAELSEQFETRYRAKQEEEAQQRALEEKAEPFKAQKRKVCEELEQQLNALKSLQTPGEEQLQALQNRLQENAKLWEAAQEALSREPAGGGEHESLDQTYLRLRNELQDYQKDLRDYLQCHAQLAELLEKSAAALAQEASLEAQAVADLQKARDRLRFPRRFAVDGAKQARIDENLQALSRRLEEQDQQKHAHIQEFTALVADLKNALQAGKSKHALNLANRGKKLLAQIPPRDQRPFEKNQLLKQFNASLKQLNELQSWRQWSNAPVKEQLVEQMQHLAELAAANADNPQFDFQDAAQRVKDARAQWKKITAAEPGASNELWEAFDAACTQAFEPCRRFFEHQAEGRTQNLQQREAACKSLEDYLEVLSHKPSDLIDWKALDKIVRVAQEEWRTLGPVERSEHTAITKRFRSVIDALRQLHVDQKDRNKEEKELLIKRAENVAKQLEEDKIALREAIEVIKQVQANWKEVGLASGDGALWKRFRGACDAVFQRREEQSTAAREERQAILDGRAAVCESIETLAKLEGDALKAAQKDFEELKQQWSALPTLQKPGQKPGKAEPLEKRFRDACRAFEAQNRQRLENERLQRLRTQEQQNRLCRQGEQLLFAGLQQDVALEQVMQQWNDLQSQWHDLPDYAHNVSKALQQRFENIGALLRQASESGVESVAAGLRVQQDERTHAKQLLCLQLEVLANIESPPQDRQARMEYQVSQLAEKMKQSASEDVMEDIESVLVKWHASGLVDAATHEALENRFERAFRAVSMKEVP